jgi:hypothetical protein
MGLALPHLERLALGAGPRRARMVVAWHRKGFRLLDLESAARPTRATYHFP